MAFSEGSADSLVIEELPLARIKSLAVTILHPSVHIVALHELKQLPSEICKSFSAKVWGNAANCNLTKQCTKAAVGLHDEDMLGNVSDLLPWSIIALPRNRGSVWARQLGGIRAKSECQRGERTPPPSRCALCGEKQHGLGRRADWEKSCKAWGKQ